MTITNQTENAQAREEYIREGEAKAYRLGNRGPIQFNEDGSLHGDILEAYWRCGFYVFEDVLRQQEITDLQTDFENLLDHAPHTKDAKVDAQGRPAIGLEFNRPFFSFAKPLSDPLGGTSKNNSRHPAKMTEPIPPADAPGYVLTNISGPLQLLDSCLRLYGHPQFLAIAEQINGPDFTPFTEAIVVKPPGLGASVAWHQDGTRQWNKSDWDEGTHGFNFMAQIYGSTAENGLWVVPGTHKQGKLDIKTMVAANGSDRLPGAVPMVCEPGGVVMSNRQILHGSFANTSQDWRATYNFGFHRRSSVLGLRTQYFDQQMVYDETHIFERSRIIALAIDARKQRYPEESRYAYQPLAGQEEAFRWNEAARATFLHDYNLRDIGI